MKPIILNKYGNEILIKKLNADQYSVKAFRGGKFADCVFMIEDGSVNQELHFDQFDMSVTGFNEAMLSFIQATPEISALLLGGERG